MAKLLLRGQYPRQVSPVHHACHRRGVDVQAGLSRACWFRSGYFCPQWPGGSPPSEKSWYRTGPDRPVTLSLREGSRGLLGLAGRPGECDL
ncbi:MAG: hypothetical protein HY698_20290 [Deltaproteobacteria bacterium]|nr:hypothetical protein [Deltaproteobacteria bacterium]